MSLIQEMGAQVRSTVDDLPVGQVATAVERLREAHESLQAAIGLAGEATVGAAVLRSAASGAGGAVEHAETAAEKLAITTQSLGNYLVSIGLEGTSTSSGSPTPSPSEGGSPLSPDDDDEKIQEGEPGEDPKKEPAAPSPGTPADKDAPAGPQDKEQQNQQTGDSEEDEAKRRAIEERHRRNRELVERIKQGDQGALEELIKENATLIKRFAEKVFDQSFTGGAIGPEDALQIALGIITADIKNYDPSKAEVTTYLGTIIPRAVRRELGRTGQTVRVGEGMRELIKEVIIENADRLNQGKPPMTDEEISKHLTRTNSSGQQVPLPLTDRDAKGGLSVESLRRAVNLTYLLGSYDRVDQKKDAKLVTKTDKPVGNETPRSPEDTVLGWGATHARRKAANDLLGVLTPREREAIKHLMGFDGNPPQEFDRNSSGYGGELAEDRTIGNEGQGQDEARCQGWQGQKPRHSRLAVSCFKCSYFVIIGI